MNKILMIGALLITVNSSYAQTWDEWFRQKKAQKKYLVQQIAALKAYLKNLKDGYNIAKNGLNTIGEIKDGTFSMDQGYVNSLMLVNSAVGGSSQVKAIAAYQRAIVDEFRKLEKLSADSRELTDEEKQYLSRVYRNILQECNLSLAELQDVIADNHLELTDDERIARVNSIYLEMKDRYAFAKSFSNSTRTLISQRASEEHAIGIEAKLIN